MWKRNFKPLILITIGDAAGIGPEIIAKTLQDQKIRTGAKIFVLGHPAFFNKFVDKSLIKTTKSVHEYSCDKLNIIEVCDAVPVTIGRPDKNSATVAIAALERAVCILKEEKDAALVTAPIYKKGMDEAGFSFPGHTEFLSHNFKKNVLMSFWGKKLRVATVTTHIPLSEVPFAITEEKVSMALDICFNSLEKFLKKKSPHVVLLGLNPHAGEEGKLGKEEIDILKPLCEEYRKKGLKITGPLPADSAFSLALKGYFDMVLGMYHDQVLAPFKMLYFETGVNVTLGLPFVRTSPDHGTAFDIAGKGIASEKSFKNALLLAIKMNRKGGK